MLKSTVHILSVVFTLSLVGCASTPTPPATPRTTVVLLPDEEGHVGAVDISTPGGSRRITTAWSSSVTGEAALPPSDVQIIGEAAVQSTYRAVLDAQPSKPKSFIFYFVLDKAILTGPSKAQLPELFAAIEARKPTEISIFGHTDSIGSDEFNLQLSARRAHAIEKILRKHDPTLGPIEIRYFGDQDPLIPTPPNAPERRNRRAEVVVL